MKKPTRKNKTSSIAHYNLVENISSLYRDGIALRIYRLYMRLLRIHLAAFYIYNNSVRIWTIAFTSILNCINRTSIIFRSTLRLLCMPCRAHMLKMPNNVCLIDFNDGQRLFGSINANNNSAVESRVYLSRASLFIIHKLIKLLVTRSPNSFTRCQKMCREKKTHRHDNYVHQSEIMVGVNVAIIRQTLVGCIHWTFDNTRMIGCYVFRSLFSVWLVAVQIEFIC